MMVRSSYLFECKTCYNGPCPYLSIAQPKKSIIKTSTNTEEQSFI